MTRPRWSKGETLANLNQHLRDQANAPRFFTTFQLHCCEFKSRNSLSSVRVEDLERRIPFWCEVFTLVASGVFLLWHSCTSKCKKTRKQTMCAMNWIGREHEISWSLLMFLTSVRKYRSTSNHVRARICCTNLSPPNFLARAVKQLCQGSQHFSQTATLSNHTSTLNTARD